MKFTTRPWVLLLAVGPAACGADTGFIAERDLAPAESGAVSSHSEDAGADSKRETPGEVAPAAEREKRVEPASSPSRGSAEETEHSPPAEETDETTSAGAEDPFASSSSRDWGACTGELHVIALYEATEWTGPDIRGVNVHIERPGSHVLALSAYESVRWNVSTAGPEVIIERIILNGYEAQEVIAPEDVAVDSYSYEAEGNQLFDPEYTWSMSWGLGNSTAPIATVEEEARRPLTTFTGCYQAGNVTLHVDSSVSVDCGEGQPSQHVNPPCERSSVDFLDTGTTSQSVDFIPASDADAWCWMLEPLGYGSIALHQVDPHDGSSFEVAQFTSADGELSSSFHTSGLGLLDGRLVLAGYMGNEMQWAQIDLGTKAVTVAGSSHYADSVASTGSELVAVCGEHQTELCTYGSFLDLARDLPARVIAAQELWGTSYSVREDVVYSARWSGDEVFVHDLDSGEKLRTIQLQNFDDWNHGLSLTSDRLYLAAASRVESPACIITFDPDTGAQLNQVCVQGQGHPQWYGLWCDGNARDPAASE